MTVTLLTFMSVSQTQTKNVCSIGFDLLSVSTPLAPFRATLLSNTPKSGTFTLDLGTPNALSQVKGFYKLYIKNPDQPYFGACLIYSKDASFPLSKGEIKADTAALIDSHTFEKIADVKVIWNREKSQLTLKSGALRPSGIRATLLGAHFLPIDFDLSKLEHGKEFGMGWFETHFIWRDYVGSQTMLPPTWLYTAPRI